MIVGRDSASMEYLEAVRGTTESVSHTTSDSHTRNGGIFTVGAARVGGAPTVGILGPSSPAAPTDGTVGAAGNLSRPYSWG